MKCNSRELEGLIKTGIVEVRGVSGVFADVETAKSAPGLVQMHAMSGLVYEVISYKAERDEFTMEEIA